MTANMKAMEVKPIVQSENITWELNWQGENRADEVAICLENASLTFREFNQSVWRMATFFRRSGIKSKSIVAIICRNELTIFTALLALARIGATTIVDDPQTLGKVVEAPTHLRIDAVVSDGETACGFTAKQVCLAKWFPEDTRLPIDYSVYEDQPAGSFLIALGSGTTGKSKMIPVGHAQMRARIEILNRMESIAAGDCVATLSTMKFFVTQARALAALCVGARAVLAGMDPLNLVQQYTVTHLGALLFQLEFLIRNVSQESKAGLNSLKVLSTGFATISDAARQRIRELLCSNLYIGYGTNESGAVSVVGPPSVFETSGTVGRPLPGVELEIVDADNRPLQSGDVGFVRLRSPGMVEGYVNDPEATQTAFVDGWFYPNDLGRMTEDGQLVHLGRADDMMIMNGINIYPAEIEQTMAKHPDVLDVVAFPIKSPVHQDIPACAVVLKHIQIRSESDLLDFGRQHLGPRGPKKIVVLDAIPRNAQGKLLRKELDAMIETMDAQSSQNVRSRRLVLRKYAQPVHSFTLHIDKSLLDCLDNVDRWLTDVVKIDLGSVVNRVDPAIPFQIKWAMERVLLLAKLLFNVVRIPVFDLPSILSVDATPQEHYAVTVAVPYVKHIRGQLFGHTLTFASNLLFKFMKKNITPENVQTLFRIIEEQYIQPYGQVSGSGKSTMPILEQAHRLNIPFIHLGHGCYQLGWGSNGRMLNRSSVGRDSAQGMMMAQNKQVSARLLRDAGLPAPQQVVVSSVDQALAEVGNLQWPVVIKPADGDRGEGVSVDVCSPEELGRAFELAQKNSHSNQVIIERQVDGVCCRVFVANQKMFYAVKRLPKSVQGNGVSTVNELINEANRIEDTLPPWMRSEIFPADEMAEAAMKKEGATLDSVPRLGERIPLRRIESTLWGGVDEDVTETIHPDNVALALRVSRLFKLYVAGVDIITPDISKPWYLNGAVVNEVNFSPHYGWGEIARKTIPAFLKLLVGGDGRIPVTVVVGNEKAMDTALKIQHEQVRNGIACYVSSHEKTFDPRAQMLHFACEGLSSRCSALLLDSRVGALILVAQNDELLSTGPPVDCIDQIIVESEVLQTERNPLKALGEKEYNGLLVLLRSLVR